MSLRSRLRRSPVYSVWRSYRESEQLRRFNRLLDDRLGKRQSSEPYSGEQIRSRLAQKQQQRRSLLSTKGRPIIAAFGTNDWEQYGLWPTLEQQSNFILFDYQQGIERRHHRSPDEPERQRLAGAFLATIDELEPACQPTLAFFYAAGSYISNGLLEELHRRGIWTVVMSLDDKQQFFQGSDQMRVAALCDLYWTVWKTGTEIVLGSGGTPWYAPEAADPAFYHPVDMPRDTRNCVCRPILRSTR